MSVYMPTECADNLPEFTECLGVMSSIIEDNGIEYAVALGDFNANIGNMFYKELCCYCKDQDWICADLNMLGESSNTFTFLSEAHGTCSWLDHCVVTMAAYNIIKNIKVVTDVSWSDHFPLVIECDLSVIVSKTTLNNNEYVNNRTVWGQRNNEQTASYTALCNDYLSKLNLDWYTLHCNGIPCDNQDHKYLIDKMYSEITNCLCRAASLSQSDNKTFNKVKRVIGWNYHIKDLHAQARLAFQLWLLHGKPKQGVIYDNMVVTRKTFKNKIKWCQNNEKQIQMDIIAEHRANNDFGSFWKSTNKLSFKPTIPVTVNNSQDTSEIAEMFARQFQVTGGLGGGLQNESSRADRRPSESLSTSITITADTILHCVKNMKRGKSPGHDGLSVEHVLYGGYLLYEILSKFYNLCLSHCYLPKYFMKTVVVPLFKNGSGNASDSKNYRPISLATIFSKIFERILHPQLLKYIKINNAQFGFRAGLSTDMAIYALKNTVKYYNSRNTTVYACFLDLSRAFDTINYKMLWSKMEEAGIPCDVLGLLKYWYGSQTNVVKWGSDGFSKEYKLECGVRQGGLTSPTLFNLYVNELIEKLSRSGVGCHMCNQPVNNLSYADDMVLLSPSIDGLRTLLSICEKYAMSHRLTYNVKKTEVMVFKHDNTNCFNPVITLAGSQLKTVSTFKYLGHIIKDNLKDDDDMERQRRSIAAKSNMLARRFARCSKSVKVTLFAAYCQSFYTCYLWKNYTQRTYHALRVQYNNAFRAMLNLPWRCSASGMFAENRVDDFYAVMRKRAASFMARIRATKNTIVKAVYECCKFNTSNI
ncbi:hypothetical protein PYW07_000456 [Mythimna separata]|uniref:Reverse transcriptase domain-containing protein n=1 Tax=Mythimna separata TaxID=271217 RepID=A0AAD8E1S3_MYTSE|nr:hypothetical protein PYW07_000456 [Mythimna separata]